MENNIDFQDKLDDMEKEFDAKCEQADLDWADRTQDNETDEN